MRLDITVADTDPDEEEWATWTPYLTECEIRVYQALRRADPETDTTILASGIGIRTNAFDRAIERLEVVGLLKIHDET